VGDLEADLLGEVETQLAWWRTECAGDPDAERELLWLLALEREQIVSVAHREEAVEARIDALVPTEPFVALRARPARQPAVARLAAWRSWTSGSLRSR
jgi:hypothetical protein